MVDLVRRFLAKPLAEDFGWRNQVFSSAQGGLYVFLFLYFFIPIRFAPGQSRVPMLALLAGGVAVATFVANFVVPRLLPRLYDEDRWTIGRFSLHTVFVLFCISLSNHLILLATGNETPSFANMFVTVTLIGFFPITLTVLLAQQRQLKRHIRQAERLNQVLPTVPSAETSPIRSPNTEPTPNQTDSSIATHSTVSISLVPSIGKDRLTLQPEQLLAVESVANYVDVYWLNGSALKKTTLRLTLKDVETAVANYSSFFRCHRAFVVNLDAVQHMTGNARGYQLTLHHLSQTIPVSRSFADAFEQRFAGYKAYR